MTRHLFAFLALLSGLAALNGPAHASFVDAMECDTSVSATAQDEGAAEQIPANAQPSTATESEAAEPPVRAAPVPQGLRLPVIMGVERAYE